jgi:hypothetical protein
MPGMSTGKRDRGGILTRVGNEVGGALGQVPIPTRLRP